MIRVSDYVNVAAWTRSLSAPARTETKDPRSWFDGDAADADVRIDGTPTARGLNIEQHAGRVLACLCGECDAAG